MSYSTNQSHLIVSLINKTAFIMIKYIPFLIFCLSISSCSDGETPSNNPVVENPDEPAIEDQGTQEDLQESMIALGFKTFLEIQNDDPSEANILISPLSIETALFMASNGAEAETLSEMRTALELGDFYPSGLNVQFEKLMNDINQDASDETFLNSAQAAFYNPNLFEMDSDFKSILEDFYQADVFDNQFNLEAINAWANDKTNERIPKVLDRIKEDEFMFLMNALYFSGDWEYPFPEESTFDRTFNVADGRNPTVPMMNQDRNLLHFIGDDLSAVDLQFKNNKFAMSFILPKDDLNSFLGSTDFMSLQSRYKRLIDNELTDSRLQMFLPKFEIKYKRELSTDLKSMGMERVFNDNLAQLEKVGNAGGNIYLTRVIHDTFLKIDEKGAEGAAVTTVGFGAESVPPTISFDRPFLVVLRHVESGVPIFIGKISDPSE